MPSAVRFAARALTRLSDWANRVTEWVLFVTAASMVLTIGLQVFFRYALNNSLFWSEELGRMFLVWLTFLGAAAAYKRKAHVGVDVFTSRLGRKAAAAVEVLVLLVSLAFFAVLAWYGWAFLDFVKFQTMAALGVDARLPVVAVPLAGALMFLHGLAFLAQLLTGDRFDETGPAMVESDP